MGLLPNNPFVFTLPKELAIVIINHFIGL